MLGRRIDDPDGMEGPPGGVEGLGLLDVETRLTSAKTLERTGGTALGQPFSGYEMHVGRTDGPDCSRPFAMLEGGRPDGASSRDGMVMGTYVHGRSEEHTSELQSLMRISYAVFCLKKKKKHTTNRNI